MADHVPLHHVLDALGGGDVVDAYRSDGAYVRELERAVVALGRERDRLRAGIRDHREAVYAELTCCDDCRAVGKEPSHTSAHDAALWALLDGQEDTDG